MMTLLLEVLDAAALLRLAFVVLMLLVRLAVEVVFSNSSVLLSFRYMAPPSPEQQVDISHRTAQNTQRLN
jgi:hypothetical protein